MDINEYISTRLDPQIEWYDKKSVHAQRRYKQFQVANDWRLINHHHYLFGANGYIRTGWHRWNPDTKQVDPSDGSGDWYYLQEDGDLQGACWHSRATGAMEVWYVEK
jgi:glucan-binding YG repeat protein